MALRTVLIAGLSIFVGLCAVPASAWAEPTKTKEDVGVKKDVARNYVIQGDEAFERGDFAVALDRFERADRLMAAPTVQLRLGRTLVRLGKLLEAKEKLSSAAQTALPSDAPPAFVNAAAEAKKELSSLEPQIPTLQIVAPGPVYKVTLNDRAIAEDAIAKPIAVNPGTYTISLPCCAARVVTTNQGDHLTLNFVARTMETTTPPPSTNFRFIGGLVTLGVGAVFLGVGVYNSVSALEVRDSIEPYQMKYRQDQDLCNIANGVAPDKPVVGSPLTFIEMSSLHDLCSRADNTRLIQIVAYPLGIVGVAVGGTLLALSRPASKPASSRLEVLPMLGATQNGILVRGEF